MLIRIGSGTHVGVVDRDATSFWQTPGKSIVIFSTTSGRAIEACTMLFRIYSRIYWIQRSRLLNLTYEIAALIAFQSIRQATVTATCS